MLAVTLVSAGEVICSVVHPSYTSPTIKIIENKGQWESQVLFKASIPGGDFYITRNAFVYALIDEKALHDALHGESAATSVKGHNYKVKFEGCNPNPSVRVEHAFTESYNYFLGNDRNKWASDCKAYEKVILQNMYDGIDVEVVAGNETIKINYIVHPGANPSAIKLSYLGTDGMRLSEDELLIATSLAQIKEEKPVAFQQQYPIGCKYQLTDSVLSFKLQSYNHSEQLIIDPNIVFGTYSGSVGDNFGFTATFDTSGNGFAGGTVYSTGFPVTLGAFQLFFAGPGQGTGTDMGILKFSADGKQLLYATYIGGGASDRPHSIVCNNAGELFILGTTESINYPVTSGAFDESYNGSADIVVSCLSADGKQMKASTFFGGSLNDGINGTDFSQRRYAPNINLLAYNYGDFYRGEIKLDGNGNVVVASCTQSGTGFPLSNSFQSTFGGGNQDGCVFRMSSDLSSLLFSSYLGGSGEDALYGLAFDSGNSIYLTGGTSSSNIGKNQGSFTFKGEVDGFIAKTNASGFSLQKLVYLGTSVYDQSYFIDIDIDNLIYITGQTLGGYPVKGNVYNTVDGRHFISILNNGLDSLMYSTVFGTGTTGINLSPSAMMVDVCGKIYVSGWGGAANANYNTATQSTFGFDITSDAFQPSTDGSDFYLIVLSKHLSSLKYATYIGGPNSGDHVDGGTSRFDKRGIVYQSICAGCGGFSDLPTTPGAYSRLNKGKRPLTGDGGCNNALVKFGADPSSRPPIIRDTIIEIIAGDSLHFISTVTDPDGDSVSVVYSGGLLTRLVNPATLTSQAGASFVQTTIKWQTSCADISPDTLVILIDAKDNACLKPNESTGKIKLIVVPPPLPIAPKPQCLVTLNDSTVMLKWPVASGKPAYQSYTVYRKLGNGPFVPFHQSTSVWEDQLIDRTAAQHLQQNVCYYIETRNSCDSVSPPSPTVCSLLLGDSAANAFSFTPDTLLYLIATDTLMYTFVVSTSNPQDSAYVIKTNGKLDDTNRIFESEDISERGRASYRFRWRSLCGDVNDTFDLNLLFRNNQCPHTLTHTARIRVVVTPPPPLDPPTMQCTRSNDSRSVLVRWTKPTGDTRYLSHYVLLRKAADGSYSSLTQTSSTEAFAFTDNQAIKNETTNWCYTVYAVNICETIGDTAIPTCTVEKTESFPANTYIYTTTVVDNEKIRTTWTRSNEKDFLKYRILRKEPNADEFVLFAEKNGINDTFLVDDKTDVQHNMYCYRIKQVNDCGLEDNNETQSCNMVLKGVSNPFVHTLEWNDFEYWKGGVNRYDIYRKDVDAPEQLIAGTGFKAAFYTDDKLNIDYGLYHYTIVAGEVGTGYTSTSNTIELIQAPIVYVPNAFTPNGDGTNDLWNTVPVFVKDFNAKVYNRWGQLLFETTDKHVLFDGRLNGIDVSVDALVYVITYTGWDGSSKTAKGNVTVLR